MSRKVPSLEARQWRGVIAVRPRRGDLNLAKISSKHRPDKRHRRRKQLNDNLDSGKTGGVITSPTIMVFDSGLGGMTVLREIVAARPEAHFVYVADDAFFPYGHHGEDEIIARVVPLIGELIDRHSPDLVVIACNTASTLVMSRLREAYQVPFVGTVPAIKPACTRSKTRRVSVLGTRGTVQREYTRGLIRDFAQDCEVTLVGSPELASLAESALSGHEVRDRDILAELAPWPVDWIDPAPAIARRVSDLLGPSPGNGDASGAEMIFTSNKPHRLNGALMPFFGGRVLA